MNLVLTAATPQSAERLTVTDRGTVSDHHPIGLPAAGMNTGLISARTARL